MTGSVGECQIARMRLLGLDLGERTIGVALCDEGEMLATPLLTVRRQGGARDQEAIGALLAEHEIGGVVLGLPLDLKGREGVAARRVRAFGERLAQALGCRVWYWDERFSTVQAERVLLDAGMRRARRKQVVDKVAAAVILQSYLDARGGEP